ncbi:MAG: hypothetical protein ACTSQP_20435 [Promethearchaeota archaeon]
MNNVSTTCSSTSLEAASQESKGSITAGPSPVPTINVLYCSGFFSRPTIAKNILPTPEATKAMTNMIRAIFFFSISILNSLKCFFIFICFF